MKSEWKAIFLKDIIEFNPRESLKKGSKAKKIPMEALSPFQRKIEFIKNENFTGGVKFRNGDTLMARITPSLENGKTAFVDILNKDEVAFGSTEFFVLRAKKDEILPKYLYYLSISNDLRNRAIKSMTGTSGRQRAQKESILDYEIFLPRLDIQKKIVDILDSLDSKIELNNQMIATLEELAAVLFKRWFVDFEFPDEKGNPYKSSGGKMGDSELGEIPEGWKVKSLTQIAIYKNGLAMQKFRPTDMDNSLPVLKIKELNQGFVDSSSDRCSIDIKDDVKVFNGDVIFSWSGTLLVKLWTGGNAGLNQHLFKVTSDQYEKWFYFLWTKQYLNQFVEIAKDKATTMGHIKRENLNNSKVCYPTTDELWKMFSGTFSGLIDKLIELGLENNSLKRTRDSLLPKLLLGELSLKKDD
ncbi:restriction endonuclease subunit S [Enterococcus sp.]|uniref:restriction endonuclease subunit S n=1 Tax=Enterococcus sp. TaxID=35783 RepID=UPI003C774BC7